MSDDRAIFGSLVNLLARDRVCRVCGCEGDSCKLETGEKCVLPAGIGAVCTNPRCINEAHYRRKRIARDRRREVARRHA